jgi:tetratricopeptide (TPR) repeat protein
MNPPQVVAIGSRAVSLLRRSNNQWELATAMSHTGFGLIQVGRVQEASRLGEELAPLATRLGHLGALWMTTLAQAILELMRSADVGRFEALAAGALEVGRQSGLGWLTHGYLYLGCARFLKGSWEEAREGYREGLRTEIPGDVWEGSALGALVQYEAYLGERTHLAESLEKLHVLKRRSEPPAIGVWLLLLGVVEALAVLEERREAARLYPLVAEGLATGTLVAGVPPALLEKRAGMAAAAAEDWERAEQHFEAALEQARSIPHRLELPEVARWHAAMLLDRGGAGDRERAARMMDEAISEYHRIGMPRHVELVEHMRRK